MHILFILRFFVKSLASAPIVLLARMRIKICAAADCFLTVQIGIFPTPFLFLPLPLLVLLCRFRYGAPLIDFSLVKSKGWPSARSALRLGVQPSQCQIEPRESVLIPVDWAEAGARS